MPVATAHSVALQGSLGHLVDVQVDVSPGVVATVLVGRVDSGLQEARDRVRMAVANSGYDWPTTRRTTVLLAPADVPKRGSHHDLAIAAAVLGATGALDPRELAGTCLLGELGLDGGLRPVVGVLPMVLAAAARGVVRVVVPEPHAREAALVPGVEVLGVRSLGQVVALLRREEVPEAPPVVEASASRLLAWRGQERAEETDLADLVGMADAKHAAEVAAAGGHHLMLSGPRGAGKTTLAERIAGLLPDLADEEALELTVVHSLAGLLEPTGELLRRPPYLAPHHTASRTSLLGGGTGRVRPGAVSQAHGGVLLLDEFPLFAADVIEALRQPLESGEITLARGEETATFPARGMAVLAANPCPCGEFSTSSRDNRCTCTEVRRRDYRARFTGPVSDRIDVVRHLVPVQPHEAHDPLAVRETTAVVRARVTAARERQARRYAGRSWRLNAHVPAAVLRDELPVPDLAAVDALVRTGRLSPRGATRVHRLAWSVADLSGRDVPSADDVDVALRLRQGEPLPLRVLGRAG